MEQAPFRNERNGDKHKEHAPSEVVLQLSVNGVDHSSDDLPEI
jgi:hypothetical protein